jgi:5-methylcytosine-specific restriction endonuclease McrA
VSRFDAQYVRQCGRCYWCQAFTLPDNLTREHLFPRRNNQRRTNGPEWVLAHKHCNTARGGLTIGSARFEKWLRRVMRNDIRRYDRRIEH